VTRETGRACPGVTTALPGGPQVTAEVAGEAVRVTVPESSHGEPTGAGDVAAADTAGFTP
jgi:hypothetical protein